MVLRDFLYSAPNREHCESGENFPFPLPLLLLLVEHCVGFVAAPPEPPRGLSVSDVSRDGCRLSWHTPASDGGAPISGYIVEKRSAAYSPRWTKVNRTPIDQQELVVEEFAMNEEVEFRVLAVNAAGYGQPCDATDVIVIKDPFGEPLTLIYYTGWGLCHTQNAALQQ